jgi:hypothetical protein
MSHRSADLRDQQSAWSADVSDDSMEFEEFAPAANAPVDGGDGSLESTEADTRPAWLRGRGSTEELATGKSAEQEDVDSDDDNMEFKSLDENNDESDGAPATRPRSRRSRRRTEPPVLPGVATAPSIEAADEEEQKLPWQAMLMGWLTDGTAGSFGASVAVHTIIAVALAIVVKESLDKNESISMTLSEADTMPIHFDEIEDISVDLAGGSEVQVPQFQDVPLTVDSALNSEVASELMSLAGSGEGDGGDEGFGFKFKMPDGGKAVSAGSFSAWTVPEDPKPGQDYMIVIRIKTPERSRTYRITDLSGELVGTDGYRLGIPIDRSHPDKTVTEKGGRLVPVRSSDKLRVVKGHVQIMVKVPGAPSLVRDMIELRSKMLKEEQKLEIVF